MWTFVALLLALSGVARSQEIEFEYDDYANFESRTFNLSLDSLFNASALGVTGTLILMIVLFEIALFALDVYYGQTYGNGSQSGYGQGSFGYGARIDKTPPLFYPPYPKYRDPYVDTYRSLGSGWSFDLILQWIATARDMYDASGEILTDLDCQKRAICEVYQDRDGLGQLGARARHGVDFLEQLAGLKMAWFVTNALDEFTDAKQSAMDVASCADLYASCDKSVSELMRRFHHNERL